MPHPPTHKPLKLQLQNWCIIYYSTPRPIKNPKKFKVNNCFEGVEYYPIINGRFAKK
jgi:hypothetical protein